MFRLSKLKGSIEMMGFKYSVLEYLKTLLFYTIVIAGASLLHKLRIEYALLIVLTTMALLPFIIYAQFRYTYECQRFNDYCLYMKQMIIQYKTHKKIKVALQMCLEAFKQNTSKMHLCIENAIHLIEQGEDFKEALEQIENEYYHSYVRKMHSYMILGEQIGGDHVYDALDNVNFEDWQSDVIRFQKQKNNVKKTNIYFTLLTIAISLFCIYFFPQDLMGNLFIHSQFQLLTFIYFEILLVTYTLVTCGLSSSWIDGKE